MRTDVSIQIIRRAVPSAVLAIALLWSAVFVGGAFAADGDSAANAKSLNSYMGSTFAGNLYPGGSVLGTGFYYFRIELSAGTVLGMDLTDVTPDPYQPLNLTAVVLSGGTYPTSVKISTTLSRLTFTAPKSTMYTIYVGGSAVGDFSVKPALLQATSLTGTSGTKAVAYNGAATIYADLKSGASQLSGMPVVLESSSNGSSGWTRASEAIAHPVAGRYQASVRRTSTRYYRFRFAGQTPYAASAGRVIKVDPRVYLSTPVLPGTISRVRSYSVYGYLKPRHTGNAVLIYADRYVGGRWVNSAIVSARASNYSSYSKYVGSLRVKYPGKWRIRAYHDDASHYPTSSAYRYVTVK